MRRSISQFMRDDSGASAAEYAMVLAIIGGAIALAAIALSGAISNSINRANNCITSGSSANSTTCG